MESKTRMIQADVERLAELQAASKFVEKERKRPDIKDPTKEPMSKEVINVKSPTFSKFNLPRLSSEIGPEIFNNPSIIPKIKPFVPSYVYGINTDCDILNLSNEDTIRVFYTAAHIGVLYDLCKQKYVFFEGHRNRIITACADARAKFIVTTDCGHDSVLIIWCGKKYTPLFTIFDIYPNHGAAVARISYNAKYLITVGYVETDDCYSIDLWMWTDGNQEPDFSIPIKKSHGKPKKVCFHPTRNEHLMVIFEKQVFFLVIDIEAKTLINFVAPHITFKNILGVFHSGTYIDKRHRCFVTSENGFVLIFANTLYLRTYLEAKLNNTKIYLKAVKISKSPLVEAREQMEIICLGDATGHIYLMDLSLTIVFYFERPQIMTLKKIGVYYPYVTTETHSAEMIYPVEEGDYPSDDEQNGLDDHDREEGEQEEESKCKHIQLHVVLSDFTTSRKPLNMSPCFVLTKSCGLYYIDFMKEILTPIFPLVECPITAIETHFELPLLIIGHENGVLKIIDYDKRVLVSQEKIKNSDSYSPDLENPTAISCIRYSNESLHLVCSNNIGEIHVLDTISLKTISKKPIRISNAKIVNIVFNFNSNQFAYYDNENSVVLFYFNCTKKEWIGLGKLMPHYLGINDILFTPVFDNSCLVTIGEDRYIVKYNNVGLGPDDTFDVLVRERIEQSAIPKCFVYFCKHYEDSFLGYYLIVDDKYKYKLLNDLTMMTRQVSLGPAYGAYKGHHIKKIMLPDKLDYKYYIFMIDKQIGLQLSTLDGNPYSYVGYTAHPTPVVDFALSHKGTHIFTFSENSNILFQWEIRPNAVELVHLLGGKEFEPFYCLLEGGKNGWLFQEIQDLFFYMQILNQGENIVLPRKFSDTIEISELPDLVRACGYYPSEFEIENLMIEARYKDLDDLGEVKTQITFFDFLKLYINHRPAHGYSMEELKDIWFGFASIPENADDDGVIYKNEYLEILTTLGENIPLDNLKKCFSTLGKRTASNDDDDEVFSNTMDFDTFVDDLLGIEMRATDVSEREDTLSNSVQSDVVLQEPVELEFDATSFANM
ncbi:cilia- and flagella-associated protein 251 [Aethina tumida]|uniref:cilia- and flagella-associated protein 251 n=1 Tax=Aethina tumida TaxID=116153 RepID=UPI00214991FD|nr:cilia- and flagella-associated protein 251 [Aethina tumida]